MLQVALADPKRTSGFLPLAEDAVRRDPGSPVVLCLAATAALLEEHPERALVFLKRYSKRYVPTGSHHLLHALALAQQNKFTAAQALLERHGPTSAPEALRAFRAGGREANGCSAGCAASWREAGRPPESA